MARDAKCTAFWEETFASSQDVLIANTTLEGVANELALPVAPLCNTTPFQFSLMWEVHVIIANPYWGNETLPPFSCWMLNRTEAAWLQIPAHFCICKHNVEYLRVRMVVCFLHSCCNPALCISEEMLPVISAENNHKANCELATHRLGRCCYSRTLSASRALNPTFSHKL